MEKELLMGLQNGSDIRGVASEGGASGCANLTEEACAQIGAAFGAWLLKKTGRGPQSLTVGIGMDSRISGPALSLALERGIASCGIRIVRCAMATTPAMFMSTVFSETDFDGAAMVTASHLPSDRNGVKFFDKGGGLEHGDIACILELAAESAAVPFRDCADYSAGTFDLISRYSEHLKSAICGALGADSSERPLSGLSIVVDAGNGSGGFFAEKVLAPLGADTSGSQFLEPDGLFPNHIPNPEDTAAMESVRGAVLANDADLGLIFDTDVDRMSAVLSDGSEVNRDAIIAMAAAIVAKEYPGSTIVTDSVASDRLTFFLEEELGLRHLRYMRGYKNVINKCIELNRSGTVCPLAMETSGHGALKDNYYLDDGAFLAVKLVVALAEARRNGKKIGALIERLPPLVEEGEYRLKISGGGFKEYGTAVLEEFRRRAMQRGLELPESYEGVRISLKGGIAQGWILLRMSLHEPVMPMNIEGARQGDLEKLVELARDLTAGFLRLDTRCLYN